MMRKKVAYLIVLFLVVSSLLQATLASHLVAEGVLEAKDVNLENHKQFYLQLSSDLSIGTSYVNIDKYLNDLGLEYSFSEKSYTVYAIVRDIKRGLLVSTSLLVRIFIKEDCKCLDKIEFELEHTGL